MTHLFSNNTNFEDYFDLQHDPSKFQPNYNYDRDIDFSSSPSHSSLQCPSKHSNDYLPTSDLDGSDKLQDDEKGYVVRSPPILNKAIQKHYEPIVDNGFTYRYEDDPHEYKKARKRVQNRISATRVRNKKKTYVEELESQVSTLKEEINQLKTTNNVLSTENTLLKQQVSFFEKLFTNKQPQTTEGALDTSSFSFNDTEIDMDTFELTKEETPSYYRSGPQGRLKKHTAFLGVMTVLLCMYGAFTAGEEFQLGNIKSGFLGSNNQVSAYSLNKIVARSVDTLSRNDSGPDQPPLNDVYSYLILGSKMIFIMIYVVYAVYVLQKIHRQYLQKKSSTL